MGNRGNGLSLLHNVWGLRQGDSSIRGNLIVVGWIHLEMSLCTCWQLMLTVGRGISWICRLGCLSVVFPHSLGFDIPWYTLPLRRWPGLQKQVPQLTRQKLHGLIWQPLRRHAASFLVLFFFFKWANHGSTQTQGRSVGCTLHGGMPRSCYKEACWMGELTVVISEK